MCEILEILDVCGTNPPGLIELYWAEVDSIDTIPPVNLTTLTITDPITMVGVATKFVKLGTIMGETMMEDEMIGPTDALHFTHSITGKIKGLSISNEAALSKAAGAKSVLLIKEASGSIRLIGNKSLPAEIITMKSSSGKLGSTDRRGTDIVIKSVGHQTKIPFYTGAMPI